MEDTTNRKVERSLSEIMQDPERADAVLADHKPPTSRRGVLSAFGLAAVGVAGSAVIPFAGNAPAGLVGSARAQGTAATAPSAAPAGPEPLDYPGKNSGLSVIGDRPLVAETPAHLLNDDTTPFEKFFIRNNGQLPKERVGDDAWQIIVEGEVNKRLDLTLGDLKKSFEPKTYRMVLECGGNGRSFFEPGTRGNQWTNGGAGCAEWTGISLADLLKAAGLKADAKFTGHFGADPHLSGDPARQALSRGMPIEKALEPHSLVVWAMNGQPLPHIHGGPVRLIIPGWPGSLSSKWLTRVLVRATPHDGQGMGGTSYRIPTVPIVPGTNVDGKTNFKDMASMPVRSLITAPANGTRQPAGSRVFDLRGAAWAGDHTVERVDVSYDFGQSWQRMELAPPKNRYDWQRWTGRIEFPTDGYYELWSRATDSRGVMQPHAAANWNPQGYGANPFHRIAVLIG